MTEVLSASSELLFRLSQNKLYMIILILHLFADKHSLTYSALQSIV